MDIDPATIAPKDMYQHMIACITPRPIAWVTTISPKGVMNLAPFSFYSGVAACPPTVVFSPVNKRDGSKKDTVRNLEAVPEFVLNVVSASLAEAMNHSAAEYAYEESEFGPSGVTPAPAQRVRPARVKEALVHLECVVHQIVLVGAGPLAANLVIGRIVLIHADDSVLNAKGQIDRVKLDTLGRMDGANYCRTRDVFPLDRPKPKSKGV
jgi:flavin reductase (DIM6/NTAB) family NADH-FMN oxidoreductase RutF